MNNTNSADVSAIVKSNVASAALELYFKTNDTVTSLDFKNFLIVNHPSIMWTQQWVSRFLMGLNMDYTLETNTNGDEYRIYTRETSQRNITKDDIIAAANRVIALDEPLTKANIKSELLLVGFQKITGFKKLFDQCGFVKTEDRDEYDDRIYAIVPSGSHYSQSKKSLIEINDMAKPHLVNALRKYGNVSVSELIDNPTSEIAQMLKAYFTFDVRQILN